MSQTCSSEVQARDRVVALGFGLFLDADGAAVGVESDHAIALGSCTW